MFIQSILADGGGCGRYIYSGRLPHQNSCKSCLLSVTCFYTNHIQTVTSVFDPAEDNNNNNNNMDEDEGEAMETDPPPFEYEVLWSENEEDDNESISQRLQKKKKKK